MERIADIHFAAVDSHVISHKEAVQQYNLSRRGPGHLPENTALGSFLSAIAYCYILYLLHPPWKIQYLQKYSNNSTQQNEITAIIQELYHVTEYHDAVIA